MPHLPTRAYVLTAPLLALLALAGGARAEEPFVFAIRGARIVPVASAPIETGTVVVRDGLIEAVGASVPVPADARVVEGQGLVVYPGLIDASSDLGLPAAPGALGAAAAGAGTGRRPGGAGTAGAAAPGGEPAGNMNPFFRAADALTDGGARAEAARLAGITTTLVVPNQGIFAGQSALVNLNGERETMVVRSPVAMHLRLSSTGGPREYPGSLMGILAYVKQAFLDARRYREAWKVYRANVRALRRPETSRALEALQPVVDRELPLVVPGNSAPEIARALKLGEECEVRIVLSGGAEAGKLAETLRARDIPVLLSLRFPEKPRDPAPDDEESLRELRRRLDAPKAAGELRKAGVKFAFASEGLTPQEFLRNAGRTVKAGLPAEDALRALTLTAADVLGADQQLGSIERGKIANLVVTDGDLFQERTRVRHVFVDGRRYDVPAEERPTPAPPQINAAGKWTVTLDGPAGKAALTFDLAQVGGALTGTIASGMNSAPVTVGTVSGKELRFRARVRIGEQDTTLLFTGTVEGDAIRGKATIDAREYDFDGRRAPGTEEQR